MDGAALDGPALDGAALGGPALGGPGVGWQPAKATPSSAAATAFLLITERQILIGPPPRVDYCRYPSPACAFEPAREGRRGEGASLRARTGLSGRRGRNYTEAP